MPGDLLQPLAFFTRTVRQSMDTFLDDADLCRGRCVLAGKNIEAELRCGGNAIVSLISNDLEQFGLKAIASLRRDNAEFSHMTADRIQYSIVRWPNQKLTAAMQHQARLLLFQISWVQNASKRPRYRLADCGSVIGVIVLAALEVGASHNLAGISLTTVWPSA